jgi:hypothetical protein
MSKFWFKNLWSIQTESALHKSATFYDKHMIKHYD